MARLLGFAVTDEPSCGDSEAVASLAPSIYSAAMTNPFLLIIL